jgi:hypothetical protein
MEPNWKKFCGESNFRVEGNQVQVALERGRRQLVEVSASDELIYLYSVVARAAIVAQFQNAALRAWQRNRAVSIVAFRVDDKGRMVGETWVPTAGLTREEFQLYIKTVAIECDRFEFQLTGTDAE